MTEEETICITGGPKRSVLLKKVFERNPGLVTFMTGERETDMRLIYMKIRYIEVLENGDFLKVYGKIERINNTLENLPECYIIYSPENQIGELGVEEEKNKKEVNIIKIQIGK